MGGALCWNSTSCMTSVPRSKSARRTSVKLASVLFESSAYVCVPWPTSSISTTSKREREVQLHRSSSSKWSRSRAAHTSNEYVGEDIERRELHGLEAEVMAYLRHHDATYVARKRITHLATEQTHTTARARASSSSERASEQLRAAWCHSDID